MIGKYAFAECESLKEIKIQSNDLKLDNNAFYKCYSLVKLTIPSKQSIENLEIRNNVQIFIQ